MGALGTKLRSIGSPATGRKGIVHWCPGCKQPHAIWTQRESGATWTWDGNVERPTCTPSVLCFSVYDKEGKPMPDGKQRTLCHYFLKAGTIEFCGDSAHEFAGQTVLLPDFPQGA